MTDETTEVIKNDHLPAAGVPNGTPDVSGTDIGQGSDLESDPGGDIVTTSEPETFSREYVEKLRQENGKYRQRAGEADSLAQRLHTELVRATGRLADPTDLPFDADHLADADKMIAAIEDLLTRKPHLATRRPIGEIGQGATPSGGTVDLAAILRGKAG